MDRVKVNYRISAFLNAILKFEDIELLRQHINSLDKNEITSWKDESGLDLFHHAIIANNMEAVNLFLTQGVFLPPHNPDNTPYLHLSCSLGHRTIMNMILQERPNDNIPAKFNYVRGGAVRREKGIDRASQDEDNLKRAFKELKMTLHEDEDGEDQMITPLDIAARNGHVACVKELLNHMDNTYLDCKPRKNKSADPGFLTLACKTNSVSALKLLLLENWAGCDIKTAIEVSLKHGNAECLDTLLRLKLVSTSEMFGGMNFFHVLFSYSLQFSGNWYELLLTVTSVLLRNGHSVRACVPSRTYPLYSLLSHPYCHDFENSSSYLTACLLLILNAGADPSFDEKKLEDDMNLLLSECSQSESETFGALLGSSSFQTGLFMEIQPAFGRPAFCSGLHCILYTLNEYSLSKLENCDILWSYVIKCVELLLHHGANPNHVGQIGENKFRGNTLHYLAHIANIGTNLKLVQLLMQFGATPDLDIDNKTPFQVLLETTLLQYSDSSNSPLASSCIQLFSAFIGVMGRRSIERAYNVLTSYVNGKHQEHQMKVFEQMLSRVEKSMSTAPSLQKTCKLQIFEHCRRKIHNVYKLPLPISLQADISNMIQYF